MKNLSLNTLTDLFGNHYGENFYLLKTPMNNITRIMNLCDEGELSPEEIHNLITQ